MCSHDLQPMSARQCTSFSMLIGHPPDISTSVCNINIYHISNSCFGRSQNDFFARDFLYCLGDTSSRQMCTSSYLPHRFPWEVFSSYRVECESIEQMRAIRRNKRGILLLIFLFFSFSLFFFFWPFSNLPAACTERNTHATETFRWCSMPTRSLFEPLVPQGLMWHGPSGEEQQRHSWHTQPQTTLILPQVPCGRRQCSL